MLRPATDVMTRLDVAEWCEKVEIAGAGFLNFRLKPSAVAEALQAAARGEHLFYQPVAQPRTVVHLTGGQGTINVNSWAPDSRRFAYVAYSVRSSGARGAAR